MKVLRSYMTPSGKVPFKLWMNGIKDPVVRHRIRSRLDRLEIGHYGDYRVLSDGVCELKLDFGPGYRIYFAEQDLVIVVLLCGGDKRSQSKDIDMAKTYWKELSERNHE
jgi:putative addiction module killer protein